MSGGIEYPSDRDIAAIRSIDEARIPEYPAPVTAVDVDALDKLREAATPGEWEVTDGQHEPGIHELGIWSKGLSRYVVEEFAPRGEVADAALIVAAVNALPDLIAEVRRGRALREAVEELAREHEKWARINAGLASEDMGGPDLHEGMRRAQEATTKHLRAVLAAVDAS